MSDDIKPIHPGEILKLDFMVPHNLGLRELAAYLELPTTTLWQIINERQGITARVAIKLGAYFGTPPKFWLNLQMNYDLKRAGYPDRNGVVYD